METGSDVQPPTPANANDDPFTTVSSSLDWLYLLHREMMKIDPATLSLADLRKRKDALAKFAEAEKLLLAEL